MAEAKPVSKSAKKSFGPQCFAVNCYNYKNDNSKAMGITFHKFPNKDKSPERHRQWVVNTRRADRKPSAWSLVCSSHFADGAIDRTGQVVRLRVGAVPTLVDLPRHLKKQVNPRRSRTSQKAAGLLREDNLQDAVGENSTGADHAVSVDHTYSGCPEVWKRKLEQREEQLEETTKKLRNCSKREKDAKEKCNSYLEALHNLNVINEELKGQLNDFQDKYEVHVKAAGF